MPITNGGAVVFRPRCWYEGRPGLACRGGQLGVGLIALA